MIAQAEMLLPGRAAGIALCLSAPISFWGGIDPGTARITLAGHPERGRSVAGQILVIPRLVGSSSSSAILLQLLHEGRAPAALILGHRDAILPVGVIVAGQMGWPTIPVALLPDPAIETGRAVKLSGSGRIETS